jgi:hypothetical protein
MHWDAEEDRRRRLAMATGWSRDENKNVQRWPPTSFSPPTSKYNMNNSNAGSRRGQEQLNEIRKLKWVWMPYALWSVLLFIGLCAVAFFQLDFEQLIGIPKHLDQLVTSALNQYAGKSALLDHLIVALANNFLFHTAPMVAILFGLWFRREPRCDTRERLVMGLLAISATAVVARSIQLMFPFGGRPIFYPGFVTPIGGGASGPVAKLSGIVSDSAAYYLGLAMLVYFHSRKIGVLAFIAAIAGAAARIYCGYHTLSAVILGGIIGLSIMTMSQLMPVPFFVHKVTNLEGKSPMLFYTAAFLACYLIANLFVDVRMLLGNI